MKEAIFLTARPIEPKLCAEALAGSVPDVRGSQSCVSFGKAQKCLYIWFPSVLREEENENFIYKDISGVPSSLPYGTHLEYHRGRELKKAVEGLRGICPELFVIDNDERVFSADEYLMQAQDD